MGLDITAYRRVEIVKDAELDSDGHPVDWDNHQRINVNRDFPGHAEGLDTSAIYNTGTEQHDFRAGSYGGYNGWRNDLARLAEYPLEKYKPSYGDERDSHCVACWNGAPGPFAELINFSDCEGVIGPVASAKLAKDFADFDERARKLDQTDFWFYARYQDWRRAFEMAADGGFVDFH